MGYLIAVPLALLPHPFFRRPKAVGREKILSLAGSKAVEVTAKIPE